MTEQTYGQWLKHNRNIRKITGPMIERLTGISASHLSRIEKGRINLPDIETRERLHEVLGTTEDDLVEAGILRKFTWPGSDQATYLDASIATEDVEAVAATRERVPVIGPDTLYVIRIGDPRVIFLDAVRDQPDQAIEGYGHIVAAMVEVARAATEVPRNLQAVETDAND